VLGTGLDPPSMAPRRPRPTDPIQPGPQAIDAARTAPTQPSNCKLLECCLTSPSTDELAPTLLKDTVSEDAHARSCPPEEKHQNQLRCRHVSRLPARISAQLRTDRPQAQD